MTPLFESSKHIKALRDEIKLAALEFHKEFDNYMFIRRYEKIKKNTHRS